MSNAVELVESAFPLVNDFAGFASRIFGLKLFSAAGARVNVSATDEFLKNEIVKIKAAALDTLALMLETEPFQIFTNAVNICLASASLVMVFDA